MGFSTHGSYTIERLDDVVVVRLSGTANIELFHQIRKELLEATEPLHSTAEPWALITDFSAWDLAPPEFFDAALAHSRRSASEGKMPSDHVVVAPTHLITEVFAAMGLIPRPDQHFHEVPTREEAFLLLAKLGYRGTSSAC